METIKEITKEEITQTWKEVFPNSLIIIVKGTIGVEYLSCKGKLAKDANESANRILENDPLYYRFSISDGNYEEYCCLLYVKPDPIKEPYNVYGSARLRKKNIKNVTLDKLKKRFEQVKAHVVANKDNFKDLLFDINDKI